MNIYLLVEGRRTEKIVYSSWLLGSISGLEEVQDFDGPTGNSLYCFSGDGFPAVIEHALPRAILDIRAVGLYDALVVVFDCDENDVQELRDRVANVVENSGGLPVNMELVVILQKRCMESWLLGNRRFIPRNAQSSDLIECKRFFDVTKFCPEEMGAPDNFERSVSSFHLHYLKSAFRERHLVYTKSRPSEAASTDYLLELRARHAAGDLPHMAPLFDFIDRAALGAGS